MSSLAYTSKVWPASIRPAASAASVKLWRMLMAGRATAADPSAERKNATCSYSSRAISAANCRTDLLWNPTSRPPSTGPRCPVPWVISSGRPSPCTAYE